MIFFDQALLDTEYLKRLGKDVCKQNRPYRFSGVLLTALQCIHNYNQNHANSFTKRIKAQQKDIKSCEGIFSEIIVYAYYLKLVQEKIIKSLDIKENDYDLQIELIAGSFLYLEIFCIMPDYKISAPPGNIIVNEVKTHLQSANTSSIRGKIINKIKKQKQFSKSRSNFAVIELNDAGIAGNFSILSSLSNSYKVKLDKRTGEIIGDGFDWNNSIFEKKIVNNIKGIIWFSLGNYNERQLIFNPNFTGTT